MIGLTDAREATLQLKNTSLFRQQAYAEGQWREADNGATIRVTNPATGVLVGTVPRMGAAETRVAIEAAAKAMPAWRAKTAKERAAVLRRWYELILANRDDLALQMTTEQGKPLHEAKAEIAFRAAFLRCDQGTAPAKSRTRSARRQADTELAKDRQLPISSTCRASDSRERPATATYRTARCAMRR